VPCSEKLVPVTEQQGCESRADTIGFRILRAAGYSPYDAAGALGRLEMYFGDTNTGVLARLSAMASDHPMTPDRLKHMRALLLQSGAAGH
jgi:predicted Zn-dependent protease